MRQSKFRLKTVEMVLFALFGALMYVSKLLLEALPNVHLLACFTVVFTVVYRKKALIPIYVFVFLMGLLNGFSAWWVPHLYLWTVLWAATMLLPTGLSDRATAICCCVLALLHGLFYGTLYAPVQALFFGLNFKATVLWIVAGLPYDLIHGVSNFFLALFCVPLIRALKAANKKIGLT